MDMQKLIQVIADVFGGKKQTGDTSSLLVVKTNLLTLRKFLISNP